LPRAGRSGPRAVRWVNKARGMMKKMSIGLYGGSFNPVHLGHLVAASDAAEALGLDRLYWVPASCSPHKTGEVMAAAEDRCAMVAAAIAGDRRMALCRWEVRRGGISYTIDTARRFRRARPEAELYLVIGADTLRELPLWREVGELLRLCRLAIVGRPGHALRWPSARLPVPNPPPVTIPSHAIGISATEIRRRLAEGRTIRYLVPQAVAAYLRRRRLYARDAVGGREGKGQTGQT